MENQEMQTERPDWMDEKDWRDLEKRHRRGKVMGGLLIVAIGSLFLARELGAEIPTWMFTWKMLLIGVGVVAAVKHKFLHPSWVVLVGIGGTFLLSDLYPHLVIKQLVLPIIAIAVGLFIMFKPRRKRYQHMYRHWNKWHGNHYKYHRHHWRRWQEGQDAPGEPTDDTKDDYIESTTCMAGVKKNIYSKKFKGGEIVNIMGGTELNLMQADFEKQAKLDITQVLGGTKLIVPANWVIKSELVTIMGSVEDKRPIAQQPINGEPDKVLVLSGDTVLGGIEIRSY
jgi:predicted membrane protein